LGSRVLPISHRIISGTVEVVFDRDFAIGTNQKLEVKMS